LEDVGRFKKGSVQTTLIEMSWHFDLEVLNKYLKFRALCHSGHMCSGGENILFLCVAGTNATR